jgi:hypothetical protein
MALIMALSFVLGAARSTIIWSIALSHQFGLECRQILRHGPFLTLLLGPIELAWRLSPTVL